MNVVLLHAFPLDERMWEPQREALRGHDVEAPRLYGLGRTMDAWAARVLDLLPEPGVAIGASMGGYCALALARRAPERLRGLVLIGSRIDADSPERRAAREDTIRVLREQGAEALWEDLGPKLLGADAPPDASARATEIARTQDADALMAGVEAIRDRPDATDVVRSLDIPLLVVVGDRDPLFAVEEAEGAARAAPNGRLLVLPDTGHLASIERPREVNEALVEFLGSLPA